MADALTELRARGLAPTTENVNAMQQLISASGGGPSNLKPLDSRERRNLDRSAQFQEFQESDPEMDAITDADFEDMIDPLPPEDPVAAEITKQVGGKKVGGSAPAGKATAAGAASDVANAEALAEVPVDEGSDLSFQNMIMGALGLGGAYKGGQMIARGARGKPKPGAQPGEMQLIEGQPQERLTGPDGKAAAGDGAPKQLTDRYTGSAREKADIIEATDAEEAAARPYKAGAARNTAKANNITVNELKEMMKDPASRKMIKGLAKKVR